MSERKSGLDILRCLALLFVLLFHSFLYNGFYYQSQSGAAMLAADSIRWLSVSCNGIFLMLSGYLKSHEMPCKCYYRNLITVIGGYIAVSMITIPIRHFLLGDSKTFSEWVQNLFSFNALYYGWYVKMYIGLLIISPIINIALKGLKTKRQLIFIAASMVIVTAMPGATRLTVFPDYWKAMYPLTYYTLGAVIRRIQPKFEPWICLSVVIATAISIGTATFMSTKGTINDAFTQEFGDLWITIITVFIFLGIYQTEIKNTKLKKIFAKASGGCYGGYLLSHLLDAWVYTLIPSWNQPENYYKAFICITIPSYIICIISGGLMTKPIKWVQKRITTKYSSNKIKINNNTKSRLEN